MTSKLLKTIKFRIKDKTKAKPLGLMARDVNLVWNVLNSASRKIWKASRKVFHKFDPWVGSIVNGASKELLINAQTIQAIRDQIHKDIRQCKKQTESINSQGISLKQTISLRLGIFRASPRVDLPSQGIRIRGRY